MEIFANFMAKCRAELGYAHRSSGLRDAVLHAIVRDAAGELRGPGAL
jgi:hypothetical protein